MQSHTCPEEFLKVPNILNILGVKVWLLDRIVYNWKEIFEIDHLSMLDSIGT